MLGPARGGCAWPGSLPAVRPGAPLVLRVRPGPTLEFRFSPGGQNSGSGTYLMIVPTVPVAVRDHGRCRSADFSRSCFRTWPVCASPGCFRPDDRCASRPVPRTRRPEGCQNPAVSVDLRLRRARFRIRRIVAPLTRCPRSFSSPRIRSSPTAGSPGPASTPAPRLPGRSVACPVGSADRPTDGRPRAGASATGCPASPADASAATSAAPWPTPTRSHGRPKTTAAAPPDDEGQSSSRRR